MPLDFLIALIMMISLTAYALMGGADYGGGVWDLFASGPRAREQRSLIAHAIGPIWEANHVWLILVVVLLFSAFPPAFALISIGLHIPLTLLLIGIVMRGSAFAFRSYAGNPQTRARWGRTFAVASLITPVLLGVIVGAITSGIVQPGKAAGIDYYFTWFVPLPLAVGLFALTLFAFLAAVYLAVEAPAAELAADFRRSALLAQTATVAAAVIVFLLSGDAAPEFRHRFAHSWWSRPLQAATGVCTALTIWALLRGRYLTARVFAAGQVSLILWGWGLAQYPYLVRPDLTVANSMAPPATVELLLICLAAGALILVPSLVYLFRIFKADQFSADS